MQRRHYVNNIFTLAFWLGQTAPCLCVVARTGWIILCSFGDPCDTGSCPHLFASVVCAWIVTRLWTCRELTPFWPCCLSIINWKERTSYCRLLRGLNYDASQEANNTINVCKDAEFATVSYFLEIYASYRHKISEEWDQKNQGMGSRSWYMHLSVTYM